MDLKIIDTFINYCNEEEYDLTNIFEDISNINDSCIYEYMQNKFKCNNKQTNTFIQKIKHYINKSNNENVSNELQLICNKLKIIYLTNIIKIIYSNYH